MREIKFRAWDGEYMLYQLNSISLEDVQIGVIWEGDDISDQKNAEYMQFTGLKDKNGIEIYEGDIIKRRTGYIFKMKLQKYSLGGAGYSSVYGYNYMDGDKVIGNIYETPELLVWKKLKT